MADEGAAAPAGGAPGNTRPGEFNPGNSGDAVRDVGITEDKTDLGITPVQHPETATRERVAEHEEHDREGGKVSRAGDPIANHNAPAPDPLDNTARDPYVAGDDTSDIGKGTSTSGGVGSLGTTRGSS